MKMIDLINSNMKVQIDEIHRLLNEFDGSKDLEVLVSSSIVGSNALSQAASQGIKCRVEPYEGDFWKIVLVST
ncbi:MAG: hypothetical protein CL750_04595 [Chloroflexi bacterium]|nr:hypothetical protein [Chloroflexota bacterium]